MSKKNRISHVFSDNFLTFISNNLESKIIANLSDGYEKEKHYSLDLSTNNRYK